MGANVYTHFRTTDAKFTGAIGDLKEFKEGMLVIEYEEICIDNIDKVSVRVVPNGEIVVGATVRVIERLRACEDSSKYIFGLGDCMVDDQMNNSYGTVVGIDYHNRTIRVSYDNSDECYWVYDKSELEVVELV